MVRLKSYDFVWEHSKWKNTRNKTTSKTFITIWYSCVNNSLKQWKLATKSESFSISIISYSLKNILESVISTKDSRCDTMEKDIIVQLHQWKYDACKIYTVLKYLMNILIIWVNVKFITFS